MGRTARLAPGLAVLGALVLALAVFRATSALPPASDCCGCGSVLAPEFAQAQPVDAEDADLGYWFVVEDCQSALAGRTREVMTGLAGGAALLGGGVGASVRARRHSAAEPYDAAARTRAPD